MTIGHHPGRTPAGWLDPSIHPAYFRLLYSLLRDARVDADALLAEVGLSWAALRVEESLLSFERWQRLVLRSVAATRQPSLGLRLGTAFHVSSHGPLGYAAMASRDLREAITTLVRYVGVRTQSIEVTLSMNDHGAEIAVRERFDFGPARLALLDMMLMIIVRLLEAAAGRPLARATYLLPFPAPAWRDEYRALIPGTLRFNADQLAIRLPLEELDSPCATADPVAHAAACRECELALASTSFELPHRLRRWLRECEGEYPTLDTMAQRCHCSRRTMIRRLKTQGTSYQTLLDEVRQETAVWYLQNSTESVESIAARLGYVDTSNFSRTFRRWFGVTPRAFRERAAAKSARP